MGLLIPIVDRVILVVMIGISWRYLAWKIPSCALIMLLLELRLDMRT
jgi:hypothetical protein